MISKIAAVRSELRRAAVRSELRRLPAESDKNWGVTFFNMRGDQLGTEYRYHDYENAVKRREVTLTETESKIELATRREEIE